MDLDIKIPCLSEFLQKKPIFYKVIDLKRMPLAFAHLNKKTKLHLGKIVHIVGTNGKGSTGRFISKYLHAQGISVAHYSSPHVFDFNERIWIDGQNISDDILEKYHVYLYENMDESIINSLSYFEYTTLLFFVICHFLEIKFIILEAGLGGEEDATNVVPKYLSLITPIGYDHKEFLGDTIAKIATTKLNSINNTAFIASQEYSEVYDIASKIAKEKQINIQKCQDMLEKNSSYSEEYISSLLATKDMPLYQKDNIELAISALMFIGKDFKSPQIDYETLLSFTMPFRCQKICHNIWIDVGHNNLSATAILNYFQAKNKKFNLVYNSFSNKDYMQILTTLKPIIDRILFIDIDDERMIKKESIDDSIEVDVDALESIDEKSDYLVFGSFLVVENFIKRFGINV